MSEKNDIAKRAENDASAENLHDKENETDRQAKPSKKSSFKELEKKLSAAQEEAQNNYDRFLRVSAEFDNYKKRSLREITEFRKYANEALIRELLPVVDNLERAVSSSRNEEHRAKELVEGVDLTLQEILKILKRFKVEPISTLGEQFDPGFHQAMAQEEADNQPPNTVLKEFQKGYLIHERLLRPAMVVVSKAKEKNKKEN